ncbi:MAG: GHKL domain-containing protein [Cellvibrionaceae bacterium]|nr:GHKL domain-containing protein [Cellvibrionaceae bacterium]
MGGPHPKNPSLAPFNRRVTRLADTLEYFSETSAQLQHTYKTLENKISELTQDLDRVSAEKDAENQKKEVLAARMQALLNFLPGGVIVLDSRGYVVQSNPAARQLLDHRLQGSLWRSVINECFSPRNDDGLEVSTKAGRRINIATSSMGDAKNSEGQIILLTDITETRDLQKKLSRNQRLSAMGKMVSALAHQVRTPLTAAVLYAGHLCNEDLDVDKRRLFSKKILSRLNHMERQVRDMLLFVKSELPLNDQLSIADLEYELVEATEVMLSTSDLHCEWDCDRGSSMKIKCHRDALTSALVNLVNNALQARKDISDRQAYLHISLRAKPDCLSITIKDRGRGMDAAQLAAVQDIFFTTKAQGTGLGLAVVTAVTRAHGGKFKLHSAPGEGTTAEVCIPAVNTVTV